MPKPKVRWVTAKEIKEIWRERGWEGEWDGNYAVTTPEGDEILLVKGRATEIDEAHERAHLKLGHLDKPIRSARQVVGTEFDAMLMTYEEYGKPRRVVMELRGLVLELKKYWQKNTSEALKIISDELLAREVPQSWLRDFKLLKTRIRQGKEYRIERAKGFK